LLYLFTFFFFFAVFNILTGTFVEKAVASAVPNREEVLLAQRESFKAGAAEFRKMFGLLDMDHEQGITLAEFKEGMKNEYVVSYMAAVGLELHDVELFFSFVAQDGESVEIDMFVEGCMAMKGPATSLDVQSTLVEARRIWHAIAALERHSTAVVNCLAAQQEHEQRIEQKLCEIASRYCEQTPSVSRV